jgi:hypothetical protein
MPDEYRKHKRPASQRAEVSTDYQAAVNATFEETST